MNKKITDKSSIEINGWSTSNLGFIALILNESNNERNKLIGWSLSMSDYLQVSLLS